jgi:hypothetical protein
MREIFLIFKNNLNEFWDFYHGANLGAGSPKAYTVAAREFIF